MLKTQIHLFDKLKNFLFFPSWLPAYTHENGEDYVSSSTFTVFFHQFSSIAGASPLYQTKFCTHNNDITKNREGDFVHMSMNARNMEVGKGGEYDGRTCYIE